MSQKVGRFTITKTTNHSNNNLPSCSKPIKNRFRVRRVYSPNSYNLFSCYVIYKSDWLNINCASDIKNKTEIYYNISQNCITPKFVSNTQLKLSFNITNDQSTQASISRINIINKRDNLKIESVNNILIQNNIILNC